MYQPLLKVTDFCLGFTGWDFQSVGSSSLLDNREDVINYGVDGCLQLKCQPQEVSISAIISNKNYRKCHKQ